MMASRSSNPAVTTVTAQPIRRYVIPACDAGGHPAGGARRPKDPTSLFVIGRAATFLMNGSFGSGLRYVSELFPHRHSGDCLRQCQLLWRHSGGAVAGGH